jgi:hypothetical protein
LASVYGATTSFMGSMTDRAMGVARERASGVGESGTKSDTESAMSIPGMAMSIPGIGSDEATGEAGASASERKMEDPERSVERSWADEREMGSGKDRARCPPMEEDRDSVSSSETSSKSEPMSESESSSETGLDDGERMKEPSDESEDCRLSVGASGDICGERRGRELCSTA